MGTAGGRNAVRRPLKGTCLTPKQEKFVSEYLKDGNGTQAAIRAGYSVKSAEAIAKETLRNPRVASAIDEKQQRHVAKLDLSAERVLSGLLREAELYGKGASHSARVTAWTRLGEHLGVLGDKPAEKNETTLNLSVNIGPDESYLRLLKVRP